MISCKDYVEHRKKEIKEVVDGFDRKPKLCVIQIGDDAASNSYIKGKHRDCEEIGLLFDHVHIKDYENFSQYNLTQLIEEKNNDDTVDGIIVQLPIPDKYDVDCVTRWIAKEKDVDGFKKDSNFTPCTPKGIMDWLKYNNYDFVGKNVTVIGRSKIVGQPLVNLLIEAGATVTCCNSKTKDIGKFIFNSDLVISAIGKAKHWRNFPNNCIVVDVGINRDENGKLCGDVDKEYVEKYWDNVYVTPSPGSVGLCTRLVLIENTIEAYMKREKVW